MKVSTNLSPQSRVWVYQAHEPFSAADTASVQAEIQGFAKQWVSHNRQLKAAGLVMHNRFVILAVDETQANASGCSIDSSVTFLRKLGENYQRDLFDRLRFSYEKDGEVVTLSKDDFATHYEEGVINDDTIVFDPLVNTIAKLKTDFKKPLKDSWHARFV